MAADVAATLAPTFTYSPEHWNPAMTTFDKREEGFEKKFALDEEQKFKAEARRNKLLGVMGGGEARTYQARRPPPTPGKSSPPNSSRAGRRRASERFTADLAPRGSGDCERAPSFICAKMDELLAQAIVQVKAGK